MIRLCKNLFYKPKYGSDADSIMLKRLFSTVTVVLVCLAAISFSAYAFFSYSVTSGTNTIQASSFSASVTIKKGDTLVTHGEIQSYYFDTPGVYTVTITVNDGTTGTGYCIVTVDGTDYYTQQLGKDLNAPGGERKEISFVLDVQAAATVNFESCWGTNSNYNSLTESEFYMKNDPLKTIAANGTQGIADNTDETTPKETIPEETKSEETQPEESTAPTEAAVTVHTVADGESLSEIAAQYDTTYQRLAAYNNLKNPRLIQPGQEIRIPPADWVMPETE